MTSAAASRPDQDRCRASAGRPDVFTDDCDRIPDGAGAGVRRAPARAARRAGERTAALRGGELPGFLPETAAVRAGDWQVAPVPAELADRRVEITGPVDRKMIINALNSGAKVWMADFEDATLAELGEHASRARGT